MAIDDDIATIPIKRKLKALEKRLLNHPKEIYAFAKDLANRLGDRVNPQDFSQTAHNILQEVEDASWKKGSPIVSYFFTHTQVACAFLDASVPYIAQQVSSQSFAERVKEVHAIEPYHSVMIDFIKRAR